MSVSRAKEIYKKVLSDPVCGFQEEAFRRQKGLRGRDESGGGGGVLSLRLNQSFNIEDPRRSNSSHQDKEKKHTRTDVAEPFSS